MKRSAGNQLTTLSINNICTRLLLPLPNRLQFLPRRTHHTHTSQIETRILRPTPQPIHTSILHNMAEYQGPIIFTPFVQDGEEPTIQIDFFRRGDQSGR